MKILKLALIASILWLVQLSAQAAINLELTQGVQGAIPIAVVPFAGQPSDMQAPDNVAGVITHDLQNSGRFRLMSATSMQQTPSSASQMDFSYWQKQSVNDVVVGSIKSVGGRYQITFQLVNPYSSKASSKSGATSAAQNSVILSQTFTVTENQLRGLAHHISDLIYQNLTGDKGYFSTRLAYVVVQQQRQYTLEVSDYDGYNPKPLLRSSQPIMSPAWSPNGQQLAYESFEDGRAAIYVQTVATGARYKLTEYPGINGAPAWSPNGQQLALVLSKSGYPKIYILTLATKALRQITNGPSIDTEPSWSRDGQSLLFTSDRGGGPQIYKVSVNGGSAQRMTFNGNYNATASYTADGNSIVVLHGESNSYNIAIQDLQTGSFRSLTRSGDAQSPSVAPNGKMVVYAKRTANSGSLAMVSTDGQVHLELPARDGQVRAPAWSPFLN